MNLADFETRLAEARVERLKKRKEERKQRRKMEDAAAKQAEEERLGRYQQGLAEGRECGLHMHVLLLVNGS